MDNDLTKTSIGSDYSVPLNLCNPTEEGIICTTKAELELKVVGPCAQEMKEYFECLVTSGMSRCEKKLEDLKACYNDSEASEGRTIPSPGY